MGIEGVTVQEWEAGGGVSDGLSWHFTSGMPVISTFRGIVIRINFRDHPPPHLHAEYSEAEALFDIRSGEVLEGRLPRAQTRLVLEWMVKHRLELMRAWDLAVVPLPTFKIAGLDED